MRLATVYVHFITKVIKKKKTEQILSVDILGLADWLLITSARSFPCRKDAKKS